MDRQPLIFVEMLYKFSLSNDISSDNGSPTLNLPEASIETKFFEWISKPMAI